MIGERRTPAFGSEALTEQNDSANLNGAVTGSCQVSASDPARVLLGMVSRGEAVPVAMLEAFARGVLEADAIGRLVLRVLDEAEPRRLGRAIEQAPTGWRFGALQQRCNSPR